DRRPVFGLLRALRGVQAARVRAAAAAEADGRLRPARPQDRSRLLRVRARRREGPRLARSLLTMASLGRTDLDVFPLCLGGNVFGWTADEAQSHAVLDEYVDGGGNFIDTANSYLVEHGQSETIIGRWLSRRASRDELVVATK